MLARECLQLPLFHDLSHEQIALIEPMLTFVSWPSGETVFEQGQAADYLYIVLKGAAIIRYKPYDGPPINVAHVEPGGIFGWSSVLGRPIYNSEACTVEETEAYRLSGTDIQGLCAKDPQTGVILLERLAAVIAERLSSTYSQILNVLVDRNSDNMRRNGPDGIE